MNEIWLAIPGFEGRYEVSDFGNVRSLPRLTNGRYGLKRANGYLLRPGPSNSGHLSVTVGTTSRGVHTLVMLAFKGVCPRNMEVLHMDHNPKNNRLGNLKYGTRSENVSMDYEVGTRPTRRVCLKFPDGTIEKFFRLTDAAKRLGVTQPAVTHALATGSTFRKTNATAYEDCEI